MSSDNDTLSLSSDGSDGLSQAPTRQQRQPRAEDDGFVPEGLACTENGRPCLAGSGSACLDFFFQVVPGISQEQFAEYFAKAWDEDRENALRLVFQLGNCRKGQGGKLDRVNFLRGLLCVWHADPSTLLLNVREVVRQGCYKTLLDLLQAVVHPGSFEANLEAAERHRAHRLAIRGRAQKAARRREKEARQAALKRAFAATQDTELADLFSPATLSLLGLELEPRGSRGDKGSWRSNCGRWVSPEMQARFQGFIRERDERLRAAAAEARLARESAVAARVAGLADAERRLYDAVAQVFADGIREDLHGGGGGLASKWAPSPGRQHDKKTLLVDAIIALLADDLRAKGGSTPRIRYQQCLAELRRAAKVPESFIGRGEWQLVDYRRMPSLCRKVYGAKLYKKHDEERYNAFLAEAKACAGTRAGPKVHTGALLPHMVTEGATEDSAEADLQWHGLVTRLMRTRDEDAVTMIPVCDVSMSMQGEPMEVAIALSMLLAESAPRDSPVFGKMFTFHEQPSLLTVPGIPDHAAGEIVDGSLARRVRWVRDMPWGGSTDFDAVLGLLLELCVQHAVPADRVAGMCVCVFSDMQFSEARGGDVATPWETAHEAVARRWREKGYPAPPRIVYWNLRVAALHGVPADAQCEGVVMLSGFSSGLLEAFLAGNLEQFTPLAQMLALLGKECYARLRVAAD